MKQDDQPCACLHFSKSWINRDCIYIFVILSLYNCLTTPILQQTQWYLYSQRVFGKKYHRVSKFSTRLPLSVRSLFCLFRTYTNDICWVCKSRTVEATNWPGRNLIFHQVPRRLNFYWLKGKKPLCRLSLGLSQRRVKYGVRLLLFILNLTKPDILPHIFLYRLW